MSKEMKYVIVDDVKPTSAGMCRIVYDERYLDNEIENQGWTIKDDKQFCPEHSEEE